MVESRYNWEDGTPLEEHTARKHKILREYLARYLQVRCAHPQQTRFRLAIVEGFAGGGRYVGGHPGSPIIFLEELRSAIEALNLKRANEKMPLLEIECFLALNDESPGTTELLKTHVEPLVAAYKVEASKLHLSVQYFQEPFEQLYPKLKPILQSARYQNVLFNLDQYGHSDVNHATLSDISASFASAEIFYTFAIQSLLTYLSPTLVDRQLAPFGLRRADLTALDGIMNKSQWLGAAERLVFENFRNCAKFVSPFSINNPDGWRYWLIHFANNNYRARQEYNVVLHDNSTMQAHFGRSGLNMLSFDPSQEGSLYLFDLPGRVQAKEQLLEDIPRLVSEFGDAVQVGDFYSSIYNLTPAHMDDIHAAMLENSDLEISTSGGGTRRSANTISVEDTLRLKKQRTMFPMFSTPKTLK